MKRYYFLLIISLLGLFFGLTITPKTTMVLNSSVEAVYSGYGLRNFLEPIMGIIASGKVTIVSPVVVKIILLFSFLGAYISLFKISNGRSGSRLRDVFTKKYWEHVDWGFKYKPVKIIKK